MLRFAEQLGSLLTRSLQSALLLVLTGAGTEDVEFNLRCSPSYHIHCATTATSDWLANPTRNEPLFLPSSLPAVYRYPTAPSPTPYTTTASNTTSTTPVCFYSIPGRAVISVFCCVWQGQPLVQHLHRDRPQPSAELLSGAAPVHGVHVCVSA